MAQHKEPIDVGHAIADILTAWRPQEGNAEDIAKAVMHALERYNINVAPTLESDLRTIFVHLQERIEERQRSF